MRNEKSGGCQEDDGWIAILSIKAFYSAHRASCRYGAQCVPAHPPYASHKPILSASYNKNSKKKIQIINNKTQ